MKNLIFILFSLLLLSACVSTDSAVKKLSQHPQSFQNNQSYLFTRSAVYSSPFKGRTFAINDLAQYFYSSDKDGVYVKLTPNFSTEELSIETLDRDKQVLKSRKFKLLSDTAENRKSQDTQSKVFYFNSPNKITTNTRTCVFDLGQSCNFDSQKIFLDQNGHLAIVSQSKGFALIFLVPIAGKTTFVDVFHKVE